MNKRFFLTAPMVLSAMVPTVTVAQSEAVIEDILVTGSYSPQARLTSSSSVLQAERIQALGKRTIAGLLKTLPGLLVEQQGGPGGLTAVSIRGAEANFTLVLLDGVPVNDPTNSRGGGYDFSNLNPAIVDRIEVVRGAQSAVYGSDALAGVINIITRRAQAGHQQQVLAEYGEDDFSNIALNATGTTGVFDYGLDLASRDEGEPVEGSTRETDSANLRVGWQLSDGHRLTASYRYLDGERSSFPEQSGGPELAVSRVLDESDYTDEVLALGWVADVTDSWRSTVTATRFESEAAYFSPGIFPFDEVPPNAADTDFEREQMQWVNRLQWSPTLELNVGADYRHEEGQSIGYLEFFGFQIPTDFELDRSTTGAFAELSAQPVDELLVQAGVRYDSPDDFDDETTWHLGASYRVAGGLVLAGNWGKAYKLPSFFALGHALVGNPDLQPELAENWDLGLAWQASEALHLDLTYFSNDFEDLIDFDPDSFTNVNRSQVETSGWELALDWQLSTALSVTGQATYTDIDVKDNASILTGRPQWTAGASAFWQISNRWDTAVDYRWTDEQFAGSRHSGALVYETLDDYHRLDWVLRWTPRDWVQVQLSVDNLLDESYETSVGFPAPGRSARLGLRLSHR